METPLSKYYEHAHTYISKVMLEKEGIDPSILSAYLVPQTSIGDLKRLNDLYERLLANAQNRGQGGGRMSNTFGNLDQKKPARWNRWQELREILFDFDPHVVAQEFDIYKFFARLKASPFELQEPKIPDYSFCLTIITGARYFQKFQSAADFYEYFKQIESMEAAERKVQNELGQVTGFGDALPLDYLKELGFVKYVKPDIHIMDICYGLCPEEMKPNKDTDGSIRVMKKIADDAGETRYALDKLFWLIGSGGFYDLPNVPPAESQKARKRWSSKRGASERKRDFVTAVKQALATGNSF